MWGRTFWLKVPQGQPSQLCQLNKCKGSKIEVYMWSLSWNIFRNGPCFATRRPVDQSVQFAPGPMDIFRTYCSAAIWCKITKRKVNRNRICNMVCLSTKNFLTSLHGHLWPQNKLSVFTNPACFAYLWRLHITGSDSTSDHCSSFAWWKHEKQTWTGPWTTMTTTFAENATGIQEATSDLTSCQVDFQLDHSSFRNALWCWQLEAEVKTPGTWAAVSLLKFCSA